MLKANWTAPSFIHALTTTKSLGLSQGPYAAFNLASHVGDEASSVQKNREKLKENLHLQNEPIWLNQTHSTDCIIVENSTSRNADAAITRCANIPLVVMTADCLPIVLCNPHNKEIAAIHAGWRGLCYGIIENTLSKMNSFPEDLMAWIGPSICRHCFEVGEEVKQAFVEKHPDFIEACRPKEQKWWIDLPKIAEMTLKNKGISQVFFSNACTFEQDQEFYSYRKNPTTGRIATLIWMTE